MKEKIYLKLGIGKTNILDMETTDEKTVKRAIRDFFKKIG